MMTDPIADMLTRIRNAQMAKKREIFVPASKVKHTIADVLVREGYLESVVETSDGQPAQLKIRLRYDVGNQPAIRSLVRESTPGHRMYRKATEIPTVLNGYGVAILSTPQGVMTSKEAKQRGLGGEVICSVY